MLHIWKCWDEWVVIQNMIKIRFWNETILKETHDSSLCTKVGREDKYGG